MAGQLVTTTDEIAVEKFLAAWIRADVAAAMHHVADDASYALYLSDELFPFAGETVGRANIEASLRLMREHFDYLVFRPYSVIHEGARVRLRVEFMYRHSASGEIVSGRFRLVLRMRDGLIVRGDEYHDREMLEAFMRHLGGPSLPQRTTQRHVAWSPRGRRRQKQREPT